MSVRAFPMPVHEQRGPGWCRWCGLAILKANGSPNGRAQWHPECVHLYKLHTWPAVQRRHVEKRDGLRCWDCGAEPQRWLRGSVVSVYRPDYHGQYVGTFQDVDLVSALELEHTLPLWATAHMEPEERRRYFGPDNLRLRCRICHGAKTKREARERGHVNRLIAKNADPETRALAKPLKRPIPNRGFSKSLKRKLNGRVERR